MAEQRSLGYKRKMMMKDVMRAELRKLHSPDANLVNFDPDKNEDFAILVQAMIGSEGADGEEAFGFVVCTPKWLDRQCKEAGRPIFAIHHIIVDHFNYEELVLLISDLCKSTEGKDWSEIGKKLDRYGQWEFSDYRL